MTIEIFKEKVHTMRPMLMSTALRIVGDRTEAEDLVQDALLRLWQLRDEPIMNVEAMGRVVVRHLAYDAVRRRHEQIAIEEVDLMDESPSEGLDDEGEQMMVFVRQLSTLQQAVLRLRHEEDMEMKDIAELVGSTEMMVRQSLSRARRKILEQYRQIRTEI